MKKLIIPITSFLLLAGNVNATDTSVSVPKQAAQQAPVLLVSATSTAAYSYEMLVEENMKLRQQAEVLSVEVDELASKLDYSHMMHTTLTNLDKELAMQSADNVKDQMDYARMMHVTLMNLTVLAAKAN